MQQKGSQYIWSNELTSLQQHCTGEFTDLYHLSKQQAASSYS